jgi:hypothetical protein
MMRAVKWVFWGAIWLLVAGWLHYTLPQHDVVRITDTYSKRIDFGANSWFWASADVGTDGTQINRDVFFIQAKRADDSIMVYRNEDTGWGWPPYFKFDTANLQAEAGDLKSAAAAPEWAVLRHYGWRNEYLTIFPNAVEIWPVDGPDVRIIPWFNIVVLTLLTAFFWALRVRWVRFRSKRIDPVLEDVEEAFDAAGEQISGTRGRLGRFFKRS